MELVRDCKEKLHVYNCASFTEWEFYIVAYLLKARIVEAKKQPLLANGPRNASRALWRHAPIEEVLQAAFSVGPRRARCYAAVR
jgi:hypothetical protein